MISRDSNSELKIITCGMNLVADYTSDPEEADTEITEVETTRKRANENTTEQQPSFFDSEDMEINPPVINQQTVALSTEPPVINHLPLQPNSAGKKPVKSNMIPPQLRLGRSNVVTEDFEAWNSKKNNNLSKTQKEEHS